MKALLSFLFGKPTDIFNKKGRVQHDLGSKKWDDWDNRLKNNPKYDYKNHSGRTRSPKGKDSKEA